MITEKRGMLREQIVKLVIAAICLAFILIFAWFIFNIFSNDKEERQAKAVLLSIIKTMNDADVSNTSSAEMYILNPAGWHIMSFPVRGSDEDYNFPDKCKNKECICICEKKEKCKPDFCYVVLNNRMIYRDYSPPTIILSVMYQLGKDFTKLKIETDKSKYYNFLFDSKPTDLNNLINPYLFGGLFRNTFLNEDEDIDYPNPIIDESNLGKCLIKKAEGEAAEINRQSIFDGATAYKYKINPFLILAIIKAKYKLFEDISSNDCNEVVVAVRKAAMKEFYIARYERGNILCEDILDDPLRELSQCITKIINEGKENRASDYFEGKTPPDAVKEISGYTIKPENFETQILWFYSQNPEEVLKISYEFKNYASLYELDANS